MESKHEKGNAAGNPRPSQPRKTYSQAAAGPSLPPASSKRREGKKSYSQAASQRQHQFFRKIAFSVGIVERVNLTNHCAYVKVTIGKGDERTVKVDADTDLRPGELVQVTFTQVAHETKPDIYGRHTEPVSEKQHPLCRGTVQYFDRSQKAWTIKTRSSRQLLKAPRGSPKLRRNQVIFFIPSFANGAIEVGKIMDCEDAPPPTWKIPDELAVRIASDFPEVSIVDPTTRADPELLRQLDIETAEKAFPRKGDPPCNAPYLQLEELMIRQSFEPETDWETDKAFHEALNCGLTPLIFISDDEPAKIHKLQRDIRSIQKAGATRAIHVLYPIPHMATPSSLKHTTSTRLLNAKSFPIQSVRMYDQPCTMERTLGRSLKTVHRRFMVISMNTAGSDLFFPIDVDSEPLLAGEAVDVKERENMMKHNLLLLVKKGDKRLDIIKSRRHPGCRVATTNHPTRQMFSSLLLTFDDPRQADGYLLSNRASTSPLYMQSAHSLHFLPSAVTVTTAKLLSPEDWKMEGRGDVYPIHQTKYVVNWTDGSTPLETHLKSLNAEARHLGRKLVFLQSWHRTGETVSLTDNPSSPNEDDPPPPEAAPRKEPQKGLCTLEATGFPSFAPRQAILNVVTPWRNSSLPGLPQIFTHSSNTCAAIFTVADAKADRLTNRTITTTLGPVTIRRRGPDEVTPPMPPREDPSRSFFSTVFPRDHAPGTDPKEDLVDNRGLPMLQAEEEKMGDAPDPEVAEAVSVVEPQAGSEDGAAENPLEAVDGKEEVAVRGGAEAVDAGKVVTDNKQDKNNTPNPQPQQKSGESNRRRPSPSGRDRGSNRGSNGAVLTTPSTPGLNIAAANKKRSLEISPSTVQTPKHHKFDPPEQFVVGPEQKEPTCGKQNGPGNPGRVAAGLRSVSQPALTSPQAPQQISATQAHAESPNPIATDPLPPAEGPQPLNHH